MVTTLLQTGPPGLVLAAAGTGSGFNQQQSPSAPALIGSPCKPIPAMAGDTGTILLAIGFNISGQHSNHPHFFRVLCEPWAKALHSSATVTSASATPRQRELLTDQAQMGREHSPRAELQLLQRLSRLDWQLNHRAVCWERRSRLLNIGRRHRVEPDFSVLLPMSRV